MCRKIPPTKVCRRCGKEKPSSEFHRNTSRTDGLQSECRQCLRERYYESRRYAPLRRATDEELREEMVRRAAASEKYREELIKEGLFTREELENEINKRKNKGNGKG